MSVISRFISTPPASRVTPNSRGISFRNTADFTGSGAINAVMPSTKPILAMLDPTALPTAKPPDPLMDAMNDTNISGADVPKETTVRPINIGDIPEFLAVAAAPITKRSALQTRMTSPAMIDKIGNNIVFISPLVKSGLLNQNQKMVQVKSKFCSCFVL